MAAPRTTFRSTTTRAGALIIAMVLSIASFWQNSHLLQAPAPAQQNDRANSNATGLAVNASAVQGQSESQSNHPQATITNTASSAAQHQSYFIIHVGPPKTATTTLQYGLRDINLTADGLLYFHHPKSPSPADAALIRNLRNDDCHKKYKQQQLNRHDDDGNTTAPDCWQPFVNELIHDRQLYGPNISWLYSSETFGIGTNPQPLYWQGLQQSLQRTLGIRLVVVITYRRYAAWLLSCHGHVTKYTGRKPAWERWGSGRRVDGLLPLVIQERDRIGSSMHFPFLYTDQMRQRIVGDNNQSASMDVRLLNLHHTMYTSPMSILLCDVLKEVTPRSCMQSIAQDANHEANNTLRLNSAMTQESDERRPTISNYDRIVTAAHDAGLLTTTNTTSLPIKRRAAGLQCRDWHQNTLQELEFDLPMECPNESHVETLWNWTLTKETALLGPGRLNTVDLRREFDKLVAYPRLCVVNATAVLQNSTWTPLWKLLI